MFTEVYFKKLLVFHEGRNGRCREDLKMLLKGSQK